MNGEPQRCRCGRVLLRAVAEPEPGVEYCIFGTCPAPPGAIQ